MLDFASVYKKVVSNVICFLEFGFLTSCFVYTQTVVSIGVTIWQMASAPCKNSRSHEMRHSQYIKAINDSSDDDCSDSENDDDSVVTTDGSVIEDTSVAMACDDGCVRIYTVSDELVYNRSLPRVSGKITCFLITTHVKPFI